MKPSQIKSALNLLVDVRRPAFVWGPPGVGKSDVLAQIAEERGIELRDVRLNLLDPVDLKGFPIADTKKKLMSWLPADFLPQDPKSEGILFLDEMNSAPASVQAAAYQLVLNRAIGDYQLPDGWAIIAAGNRESDRSVVNRMPSALANRLVHLNFDADLNEWCLWAMKNDLPDEIIGFLRFRPELFHQFNKDARAYATPRSWTFASQLINSGLDVDTEMQLLSGTVGEGPAGELLGFLQIYRQLPTIDAVLANPEKIAVPEEMSARYAITTALGRRADDNNFPTIMKFMKRMPAEFQVVFVRDCIIQNESIATLKEYREWAIKNADVLI